MERKIASEVHKEKRLGSAVKLTDNVMLKGRDTDYHGFYAMCVLYFDEIEGEESRIRQIFNCFDFDKDGMLTGKEMQAFDNWVLSLTPKTAIIVIDVQNDFIDGSLALRSCEYKQDGADVIAPINNLLKHGKFDKIIYSVDWHPEDHISFYENLHLRMVHEDSKVTKENAKLFDKVTFAEPYVEQVLWPKHCVMGTWGAELHKDLLIVSDSEQIYKGDDPETDAYSAFAGKKRDGSMNLQAILQNSGITDVYVCGLAYDVCVKASCLDGLRMGFAVAVIDDCCRGVDKTNTENAKRLITENGGLITNSEHVLSMVNKRKLSIVMGQKKAEVMASASFGREASQNVSE